MFILYRITSVDFIPEGILGVGYCLGVNREEEVVYNNYACKIKLKTVVGGCQVLHN